MVMYSSELRRSSRNSVPYGARRSRSLSWQYITSAKKKMNTAADQIYTGFYLISFWYKREEAQWRFTIYWCSTLIANAFGGLLASAIAEMDGVGGYSNWRWIFILEGIFTILVAIAAFFLLADFPEDAKWLKEDERRWVIAKTGKDKEMFRNIVAKDLSRFFSDPKNLFGGIIYFGKP